MTEYNVKVSIIIPHWNGIETLSECISSLLKIKHDSYEIIVVDNNLPIVDLPPPIIPIKKMLFNTLP